MSSYLGDFLLYKDLTHISLLDIGVNCDGSTEYPQQFG